MEWEEEVLLLPLLKLIVSVENVPKTVELGEYPCKVNTMSSY